MLRRSNQVWRPLSFGVIQYWHLRFPLVLKTIHCYALKCSLHTHHKKSNTNFKNHPIQSNPAWRPLFVGIIQYRHQKSWLVLKLYHGWIRAYAVCTSRLLCSFCYCYFFLSQEYWLSKRRGWNNIKMSSRCTTRITSAIFCWSDSQYLILNIITIVLPMRRTEYKFQVNAKQEPFFTFLLKGNLISNILGKICSCRKVLKLISNDVRSKTVDIFINKYCQFKLGHLPVYKRLDIFKCTFKR